MILHEQSTSGTIAGELTPHSSEIYNSQYFLFHHTPLTKKLIKFMHKGLICYLRAKSVNSIEWYFESFKMWHSTSHWNDSSWCSNESVRIQFSQPNRSTGTTQTFLLKSDSTVYEMLPYFQRQTMPFLHFWSLRLQLWRQRGPRTTSIQDTLHWDEFRYKDCCSYWSHLRAKWVDRYFDRIQNVMSYPPFQLMQQWICQNPIFITLHMRAWAELGNLLPWYPVRQTAL